ncbi:MAG: hypothetical protein WC548_00355 [Candidatus Pacearchaeota archaeon]
MERQRIIQPEKEIIIYHIGKYEDGGRGHFGREFGVWSQIYPCHLEPDNKGGLIYVLGKGSRVGNFSGNFFRQELMGALRALYNEPSLSVLRMYRVWDADSYISVEEEDKLISPGKEFVDELLETSAVSLKLRTEPVGQLIKEGLIELAR